MFETYKANSRLDKVLSSLLSQLSNTFDSIILTTNYILLKRIAPALNRLYIELTINVVYNNFKLTETLLSKHSQDVMSLCHIVNPSAARRRNKNTMMLFTVVIEIILKDTSIQKEDNEVLIPNSCP